MTKLFSILACTVGLLAGASAANADIFAMDLGLGTNPLPTNFALGPYTVMELPDDPQPVGYAAVSSAPAAPVLAADILFSPDVQHAQVGTDWATWAMTREPDIYWTGGATDLWIDLPAGTAAFALWAEPEAFAIHDITMTAMDLAGTPTPLTLSPDGQGGALGFGFYAVAGQLIDQIHISSAQDFAVGEFYGSRIPEPATIGLLAMGGLALLRRRRQMAS